MLIGLTLAVLAGLVHVFIFYLESIAWEGSQARKVFGIASAEEAQQTKSLAFNQGFYNLFLAILALGGVAAWCADYRVVGLTMVFSAVGSMFAAALVLFLSSASHRAAAVKQGGVPLAALVALILGLML